MFVSFIVYLCVCTLVYMYVQLFCINQDAPRGISSVNFTSDEVCIQNPMKTHNCARIKASTNNKKWQHPQENSQVIPDLKHKTAVAKFRLSTGHDFHRIESTPNQHFSSSIHTIPSTVFMIYHFTWCSHVTFAGTSSKTMSRNE